MFLVILYVSAIILWTDLGMLIVSNINIDKDNNTTWIRGNYCYKAYLIKHYKSKCTCLLYTHFPRVQS